MGRLRTFLAIDLGQSVRDRCVSLQETLARTGVEVKWVEEENLHVTLLFLGEVDEREVPALCKAVADTCTQHDVFTMSVESLGCFPNPRRPRTLWVAVGKGNAEVCALHDALEVPLLELGCYRREERQYTPHITLGRVKGDRPATQLAGALTKQAKWRAGEVEVRELQVKSSKLTPDGPEYTTLSRARLRPPTGDRGKIEEEE
jgi:2'-5' RNA ligase